MNLNQAFVTKNRHDFQLNGELYRFAGASNYNLFYKSYLLIDDMIDYVMENMQQNGIKMLRTLGFADCKKPYTADGDNGLPDGNEDGVFQSEWGFFYEPTFVNFDCIIKSAGEYSIRLIIPLVNYWLDRDSIDSHNCFGGMAQYLEWCNVELEYDDNVNLI